MPKLPRSQKDTESIKTRILEAALEIIYKEGFKYLSMRKLADKTSMTAANLYNFFSNKDEIYLAIQTHGFIELYEKYTAINQEFSFPAEKLREFMKAYLRFGFENSDLYEIMFTRNTPKYADYVGTELENVAFIEKEAAMKSADIATAIIAEIQQQNSSISDLDARNQMILIWTTLHGFVSLHNSRVLQEVDDDIETLIQQTVKSLMRPFQSDAKN
ncbi:TetR/AcrR family transcriptional regulator [bacterium]|nr:TetR/AcrR family transcriptional regulator [bacterium]